MVPQQFATDISIHSARVGGDTEVQAVAEFLPISIHSARVGGDRIAALLPIPRKYFNPLRPCGRRRAAASARIIISLISIHSARVGGDNNIFGATAGDRWISIHSARVGGDLRDTCCRWAIRYFNPLRPCGRRLMRRVTVFLPSNFNPLRPCGRRQQKAPVFCSFIYVYYNIFYRKKQAASIDIFYFKPLFRTLR